MPNLFRTPDGHEWKPGDTLPLTLPDGTTTEGIWAGSATEEKLAGWLRPRGNQIAQSEMVTSVASKADDNGEMIWGDAPNGAHLLFIVVAPDAGKKYRLAKLVTTAANAAQIDYFRHHRSSLLGHLNPDGTIARIPPLNPPPPPPPAQGELF